VDQATAAQTITELEAEITSLEILIKQARVVRQTEEDRKWIELSNLLQDNVEMRDRYGDRRKLILFTEHKDTLFYLYDRITSLLAGFTVLVRPKCVIFGTWWLAKPVKVMCFSDFLSSLNKCVKPSGVRSLISWGRFLTTIR